MGTTREIVKYELSETGSLCMSCQTRPHSSSYPYIWYTTWSNDTILYIHNASMNNSGQYKCVTEWDNRGYSTRLFQVELLEDTSLSTMTVITIVVLVIITLVIAAIMLVVETR